MTQDGVDETLEHDKGNEQIVEESGYSESSGLDYDYKLDVLPNGQLCVRRYRSKKHHDTRCCN